MWVRLVFVLVVCAILFVPVAIAQDADLDKLNAEVARLYKAGKYPEAEATAKKYVALAKEVHGPDHAKYATAISWLGTIYQFQGRYREAELRLEQALAIREKVLGSDHPNVANSHSNLAVLYELQAKYDEAVLHLKRAVAIHEKKPFPEGLNLATVFNNLAVNYYKQGRYLEAEPLYKRSLAIREGILGSDHVDVAQSFNNLAELYRNQGRYQEAVQLYQRSLAISEKELTPSHPGVSGVLNNLGLVYIDQSRYKEAEPLFKRALAIREKVFGPDHPEVAQSLVNLAGVYDDQADYEKVEPLLLRAIAIWEMALGSNHPEVATALNNLAELHLAQGRYGDAEPLHKRALAIREKALGPGHPDVATSLNNLAGLYDAQGRYGKAEPLYKRALAIWEKALGPGHPDVALSLSNLARLSLATEDWRQAAARWHGATDILIRRARRLDTIGQGLTGKKKSEVAQNDGYFRGLVKAVYRGETAAEDLQSRGKEMFAAAQWAIGSQAAGALAQMSARMGAGSGDLAQLVRESQDKLAAWQTMEKRLNKLRGAGKRDEQLERKMAAIDKRIGEIDERLVADFPNYAALANPEPLTTDAVQKLLRPDEALVLLLDTPSMKTTPAETFIWAVTRDETVWHRAELGGKGLANLVAKLRCGLDGSNWADFSNWAASRDWEKQAKAAQQARRDTCIKLIGKAYSDRDWPPFDFQAAETLYKTLLGPIEDTIKDKKLLVVASGALTGLPLQVLVSGAGDPKLDGFERYKSARWLIRDHAITTLPSVASLKALRGLPHAAAQAERPLTGFADPEFWQPESGDTRLASAAPVGRSPLRGYSRFFSGRSADLAVLASSLPRLEGTRRELHAVGNILKADSADLHFGRKASEATVKSTPLNRYRIVYFATHGLVAGNVEGLGEPALAFSLPDKATAEDDGLLTASEVTQLKLNADWVVMSACNTASADKPGAEALSGLARAFFYAGARTLLVSHWPVGDEAAVSLTTHAFKDMEADPKLGRAEALRRSMLALIDKGGTNAHPTVWAPFVLVGEGAAR